MTIQINDKFLYNGYEYHITAVEYPSDFFDINDYGLEPTKGSADCLRGYIATFALNDKKLVLKQLETNNGNKEKFEAPPINNKHPEIIITRGLNLLEQIKNHTILRNSKSWKTTIENYGNWKEYLYKDVDLMLNYTGSIIISRYRIVVEDSIHIDFQSAPRYVKSGFNLKFRNGELEDITEIVSQSREEETDCEGIPVYLKKTGLSTDRK